MTTVDTPGLWHDLAADLHGRLVTPADADFGTARLPWNVAVAQEPLAVVEAADVDDVVSVLRAAGRHRVPVAAQPVGHGATPAVGGTLLLRTTALDTVSVDTAAKLARVGAGATWGRVLDSLDGTGLVALSGSNPSVSVVGYLLGGGLSWFGRRFGVACHTLRRAEVVDASGRRRWVDDTTDADLMWALRGGGGDFCIVTEAEIDLQPGPELCGGALVFPAGASAAVLSAYREVMDAAPAELTAWAAVMHLPDLPEVPDPLRGASVAMVVFTHLGPVAELDRLLGPLRAAGPVLMQQVGPVPVGRLGEVAAEPTTPMPAIEWSAPLADLDEGTVEGIVDAAADRATTALTAVQIRRLGGAFTDPPVERPAAFARATSGYVAHAFGVPAVPELLAPIRQSLQTLAGSVQPSSDRLPLNFLTDAGLDRSFAAPDLERLRSVKAAVDPDGIVRSNHPIG